MAAPPGQHHRMPAPSRPRAGPSVCRHSGCRRILHLSKCAALVQGGAAAAPAGAGAAAETAVAAAGIAAALPWRAIIRLPTVPTRHSDIHLHLQRLTGFYNNYCEVANTGTSHIITRCPPRHRCRCSLQSQSQAETPHCRSPPQQPPPLLPPQLLRQPRWLLLQARRRQAPELVQRLRQLQTAAELLPLLLGQVMARRQRQQALLALQPCLKRPAAAPQGAELALAPAQPALLGRPAPLLLPVLQPVAMLAALRAAGAAGLPLHLPFLHPPPAVPAAAAAREAAAAAPAVPAGAAAAHLHGSRSEACCAQGLPRQRLQTPIQLPPRGARQRAAAGSGGAAAPHKPAGPAEER